MNIKKLLGQKIKNLRIKKGLTQGELAKMAGISQRSLSGIEIGENFLTSETLENLLKSFNITIDQLFALEHLKSTEELKAELLAEISSIEDEKTTRLIYKIVKSILKD